MHITRDADVIPHNETVGKNLVGDRRVRHCVGGLSMRRSTRPTQRPMPTGVKTLAEYPQLAISPIVWTFLELVASLEFVNLAVGRQIPLRAHNIVWPDQGVPLRFSPYAGDCGSPLAFVVSKNLKRRQLTESQRALVAARLKPHFK